MAKYWTPSQKGKNILLTFLAAQEWKFEKDSQARYKNNSYIQSAELNTLDELREKNSQSRQYKIYNQQINK